MIAREVLHLILRDFMILIKHLTEHTYLQLSFPRTIFQDLPSLESVSYMKVERTPCTFRLCLDFRFDKQLIKGKEKALQEEKSYTFSFPLLKFNKYSLTPKIFYID